MWLYKVCSSFGLIGLLLINCHRPSSVFASTSHRFEDSTLNQQSSHISSFLDFSVSSFRSVPSISKDSFLPITAKPVERHGKYSTCFVGGYLDQISTMETDKSLNFSERSHPEVKRRIRRIRRIKKNFSS